jgi:hypothetical protein
MLEARAISTQAILLDTQSAPLHLMRRPANCAVSSMSRWEDVEWQFDVSNGGYVNWAFELPDGARFSDPRHAPLLDVFKRFLWSRMADPREGKAIKPSNANLTSIEMKRLVSWMNVKGYDDISMLDPDAFDEFTEHYVAEIEGGESEFDDDQLTMDEGEHEALETVPIANSNGWGRLFRAFSLWAQLWAQSGALRDAKVTPLPADPLRGLTAHKIASQIADRIENRIPPLPDEVAIPIMNEAHKWLGVRADDIIVLHHHYMDTIQSWRTNAGRVLQGRVQKWHADQLGTFEFSVEPGCDKPWREAIRAERLPELSKAKVRPRPVYTFPTQVVRDLVDTVREACVTVIQSETGMRIGEVVKLPSGFDPLSGQYSAIKTRVSKTGLNELFYLRSALEKTVDSPLREEWLGGSRPVGSSYLPGPYRAVQVLQSLLAPWRDRSDNAEAKGALIVHVANGPGLPRDDIVISPTGTKALRKMLKAWTEACVDLSKLPDKSRLDENLIPYRKSNGKCIKTHQWRKTFAMYVVRTNRRMIPEVATQFKHLSVAMTENTYISSDPDLLRERDSQQARAAAAFMYTKVTGNAPTAGRIAKIIEEHADSIAAVIGKKHGVAALNELEDWCANRSIKVFSSPHGKCFIGLQPTEARCHEVAGTTHWSNRRPDFATREPDLCNGCGCFGVDLDHADFWKDRYVEYQAAWLKAKAGGLRAGYRVIQERAAQSANLLKALQIQLPSLSGESHAKKAT